MSPWPEPNHRNSHKLGEKVFLMWKSLLCEGCSAIACKEMVENVIEWLLTAETVLYSSGQGSSRMVGAGLGNEMSPKPCWDLKASGTGSYHLERGELLKVIASVTGWNIQLWDAACQRACVVYQHPHPPGLERRLDLFMAPMEGHWPEVWVSAVSSLPFGW